MKRWYQAGAAARTSADRMSVDLASRRTGMAFHQTRMSADRTLLSVVRTSIALIAFGFTLFQLFVRLGEAQGRGSAPARRFGIALVLLGIAVLALGIVVHTRFVRGLRGEGEEIWRGGMEAGRSRFHLSAPLAAALLVLVAGGAAFVGMVFGIGPFG